MIDIAIGISFLVILVTVLIVYVTRSRETDAGSRIAKPRTKQQLLDARLKHFQGTPQVENATNGDDSVSEEDSSTNDRGTEQEGDSVVVGSKSCLEETPGAKNEKLQSVASSTQNSNLDGALFDGDVESKHVPEESTSAPITERNQEEALEDVGVNKKPIKHAEIMLRGSPFLTHTQHPEIKPLKNMQELLSWVPGFDAAVVGGVVKRPVCAADRTKPRTMICHDMKGGYIEDRFVQGCASLECFRLSEWSMIDSFCYFSHSFITIPPPGWTNAAHNNGVKMLGTLITEWDDGAAICTELFQSVSFIDNVVDLLVEISSYYCFDGWLINIENPIDPTRIENIRHFLVTLTGRMHMRIPDSEVIWYDSVTRNGQLKWQNKLCNENKMFFDACDGIFLNYNWSANDLRLSYELSGAHRRRDVYVGVDVFGRGCFGGGGWNTNKAMQVIREQNLSAAIFAPGWVMETLPPDQFTANSEKFWNLIRDYLYGHCATKLPLISTFCEGYGSKIYLCGQKVAVQPWSNLSATSMLPSFTNNFYQLGRTDGMEILFSGFSTSNGYSGGGSYMINGHVFCHEGEQTKTVFRLFETRITLKPLKEYFLSYTFQQENNDVEVFLLMLFDDRPNYLLFIPEQGTESSPSTKYSVPLTQEGNYVEVSPGTSDGLSAADIEHSSDWITRRYKFSLREQRGLLKEIRFACVARTLEQPLGNSSEMLSAAIRKTSFQICLGEFRLHTLAELTAKLPTPEDLRCSDVKVRSEGKHSWLSFMLSWETPLTQGSRLPKFFDVYCHSECDLASSNVSLRAVSGQKYGSYLGRTYTNYYYISDLVVQRPCTEGVKLVVQAVSYAEVRQPWINCGKIILKW